MKSENTLRFIDFKPPFLSRRQTIIPVGRFKSQSYYRNGVSFLFFSDLEPDYHAYIFTCIAFRIGADGRALTFVHPGKPK